MGNLTFGQKIGAGFGLAVLALVVVAVVGYRSISVLIANDERVAHTHQVRSEIDQVMIEILDAETGFRGFVITGKEEFLAPYLASAGQVGPAMDQLRQSTSDNPSQQHRLDALKEPIDKKLEHLRKGIEFRRGAGGFEAALGQINTGDGQISMSGVRKILNEMDAEEARLLASRDAEAASSTRLATSVIVWGSIAAVVLTLLVGFLITRSLSGQITVAVRNVQSSSTELQASANQQASGAREQATAMAEIATTISELLATSRQIAESAQRVSQIANQTAGSARAGEATVSKGSDAIATVRRQVDTIVGHMLDLGKKSQQVGAVLDIVSELAEQTNILAINATIEAAGAGEVGRRFGVVADEIRKLADRVAASTKEIRGMVEDVRAAANTSVMATEAGSKAVDTGGAQVLEMAVAFRHIAALVGTTTDAAREIELSTKQQATAVEQVNVAITNVAQATRQAESGAGQTLQTSVELALLSNGLLKIVQSKAS